MLQKVEEPGSISRFKRSLGKFTAKISMNKCRKQERMLSNDYSFCREYEGKGLWKVARLTCYHSMASPIGTSGDRVPG